MRLPFLALHPFFDFHVQNRQVTNLTVRHCGKKEKLAQLFLKQNLEKKNYGH
jgi:hypothetical protein